MVDFKAVSPLADQSFPTTIGNVVLDIVQLDRVFSIMPFAGQSAALSEALSAKTGLGLPDIGMGHAAGDAELFWTGQNQWFLRGVPAADLALSKLGAITDQSDGWAVFSLRGDHATDVMARLCPLDLRGFSVGQVARTEFAHMMSIILPKDGGYDIWVMRSFAQTAFHHLKDAAQAVAAIKSLPS